MPDRKDIALRLFPLAAAPLALMLAACAAQSEAKAPKTPPLTEAQKAFIADMHAKYDIDTQALGKALAHPPREDILTLMTRAPERTKAWYEYRPILVTDARAQAGIAFWKAHAEALKKAEKTYGVPAEYILAIIGVETYYGRIKGKFPVVEALNTLSFYYPPRATFFKSELEAFVRLSKEEGWRFDQAQGSYAGAMGYGQFMPSNYRTLGIDFDGDGHRDLIGNPVDAIGSVANYLKHHGWQSGGPLVQAVTAGPKAAERLAAKNYQPRWTTGELKAAGVHAEPPVPADVKAAYLELDLDANTKGQWLTYQNFYVITRYNRSPMYAMAVTELAGLIKSGYNQDHNSQAPRG